MTWNRPAETDRAPRVTREPKRSRGMLRGLVAALIVVGGAVVVFLLVGRSGPEKPASEAAKSRAIAEVRPKVAASVEPAVTTRVDAVARTAPTGRVTKVRATRQMRTLADGTQVPVSQSPFTNGVERALATLCNPGGMAIPLSAALRRFPESEILRIINTPTEYDKNDERWLKIRKLEIQRLKDDVKAYLREGGTLKDALAEIDRKVRSDGSYMMMVRKTMNEALATKDGEVVRKFVERTNEKLEEKGMRPLEVPEKYRLPEAAEGKVKTEEEQ